MGLVGVYQEGFNPGRVYEGCTREMRRKRSFDGVREDPSEPHGTIYTHKPAEVAHTKPFTDRVARIIRNDETLTTPNRIMALAHLLEYHALAGMRKSAKALETAPGERIDVALAPSWLEEGVGMPFREPGIDLLVSHMKGGGNGPREITVGMNIKSSQRHWSRTKFWLSRRIGCAPSFNMHLGGWIISANGENKLQKKMSHAAQTNEDSQRFIEFMEMNAEPFGQYAFHHLASATYAYEAMAERHGHLRFCSPEWAQMFPEDPTTYAHTLSRISRLNTLLRSNRVPSIWSQNTLPPDYTYMQFLPVGTT